MGNSHLQFSVLATCFALLMSIGCGGRPIQEMAAAETALANAALAKKCAPEEYRAAQRMYAKAEKYVKEEQYAKAEAAAKAAEKLAKKAEQKALARREECLKAPAPPAEEDKTAVTTPEDANTRPINGADQDLAAVYFKFNAFKLSPESRNVISANAERLRAQNYSRVQVAGHCDARGSTEYNLALGEKRALAARQYLISLGIAKDRVEMMSYGEEQLVDYGESEAAHARNRRAEFKAD